VLANGQSGEAEETEYLLGEFEYKVGEGAPQVQTFEVAEERQRWFSWVRFQVLDNHGNERWTCIYRVRVH